MAINGDMLEILREYQESNHLETKNPAYLIELDDGKIYRKALYLMGKTMVSCRFSLKPIHWLSAYHGDNEDRWEARVRNPTINWILSESKPSLITGPGGLEPWNFMNVHILGIIIQTIQTISYHLLHSFHGNSHPRSSQWIGDRCHWW